MAARGPRTALGWLFAPVSPVAPCVTRMNSGHRFDWTLLMGIGENRLIFAGRTSPRFGQPGPTVSPAPPSARALSVACGKIDKCKPLIQHLHRCSSPPNGVLHKRFGRTRRLLQPSGQLSPWLTKFVFSRLSRLAVIRQVCVNHTAHTLLLYQSSHGSDSISRQATASSTGRPTSQDAQIA